MKKSFLLIACTILSLSIFAQTPATSTSSEKQTKKPEHTKRGTVTTKKHHNNGNKEVTKPISEPTNK